MYDGLLVGVRVDCCRREIVPGSEIRIDKETQLYGQLIEGCIFLMNLRCDLVLAEAMSLKKTANRNISNNNTMRKVCQDCEQKKVYNINQGGQHK